MQPADMLVSPGRQKSLPAQGPLAAAMALLHVLGHSVWLNFVLFKYGHAIKASWFADWQPDEWWSFCEATAVAVWLLHEANALDAVNDICVSGLLKSRVPSQSLRTADTEALQSPWQFELSVGEQAAALLTKA